jgi:hypothetical protein
MHLTGEGYPVKINEIGKGAGRNFSKYHKAKHGQS